MWGPLLLNLGLSSEQGDPLELSDDLLMRRYQQGDIDAFDTLIRRYEMPISTYCLNTLSRSRGRELAADVTQEVFLKLIERGHTYKPRGTFKSWLFTVARNLCIDALRRPRLLDIDLNEHENTATTSSAPDTNLRLQQLTALLDRALSSELTSRQRDIIVLHLSGLEHAEIATVLEISRGTVKYHAFEARKRLRAYLSDFLEE